MKRTVLALGFAVAVCDPAFAHLDSVAPGSFAAGVSHPLSGLDHILTMVAVGLWAALLGGRALWLMPAAFVVAMALGFTAARLSLPLPFIEPVILASVIVTGLLTAAALRVPVAAGAAIASVFALFHGHAHGGELGAEGALPFAAGFAAITAFLHTVGLALGLGFAQMAGEPTGRIATRIAGVVTALAGIWLAATA